MEEIFRVDPALQERIINKCKKSESIEFGFGPFKMGLQNQIIHDLLKMPEQEVGTMFGKIIRIFDQTCNEYQIPYSPLNIHVVADDEIKDRASSQIVEIGDDSTRWGFILIPTISWELDELWSYYFLHELGHCWISISWQIETDHPDFAYTELFLDLITICCLRKKFPPHTKTLRDVLKDTTHIAGIGGQKILGKKKQKDILENPEQFLKKFTGNIVLLFKDKSLVDLSQKGGEPA